MLFMLLALVAVTIISIFAWPVMMVMKIPRFSIYGLVFYIAATVFYILTFLMARRYYEEYGESLAGIVWLLAIFSYVLFTVLMII